MHLRKAKLMFFYVRYPSSAVLKDYFPDVKFNKNNTAQLVKWFSNFRSAPAFFSFELPNTKFTLKYVFDMVDLFRFITSYTDPVYAEAEVYGV